MIFLLCHSHLGKAVLIGTHKHGNDTIRKKQMSRKNNLQKATAVWKQLERKTEEQRKEAENYYASNLMGVTEEAFIKNNREIRYGVWSHIFFLH